MASPVHSAILDLGGGLASRGTALTFIFVISLVLIFLLGFAIRDALQKRGNRVRAVKSANRVSPRQ